MNSSEQHVIKPRIFSEIQICLKDIEQKNDVRILYACESGSRAWGFESKDSDYDVRFIYVRPRDWYISIDVERRRDVIEIPINDDLDISGWDIRKTLQLFYKSNPPLHEWLLSPIVYGSQGTLANTLRELAPSFYNSVSARYHYLSMASKTHKTQLTGSKVKRKKYLYALRPLLAVEWIEKGMGVVPIRFDRLVEGTVSDQDLLEEIQQLLAVKRRGKETDAGPRFERIHSFIETKLQQYGENSSLEPGSLADLDILNRLFRETIEEDSHSEE